MLLEVEDDRSMHWEGPHFAVSLTLQYSGCYVLHDDVRVTLDGVDIPAAYRGEARDYCAAGYTNALFKLEEPVAPGVDPEVSRLEIGDASERWTIDVPGLRATFDLPPSLVSGATAQVAWRSALPIDGAQLRFLQNGSPVFELSSRPGFLAPPTLQLEDSAIIFEVPDAVQGPGTLQVSTGSSSVSRFFACEGPSLCRVSVSASADIATTIVP